MTTVALRIHYNTCWGQRLFVSGNVENLGNNEVVEALPLEYDTEGYWKVEFAISSNTSLKYYYVLQDVDGSLEEEAGERQIDIQTQVRISVQDTWRSSTNPENPFLSSAFTKAILSRHRLDKKDVVHTATLQLQLRSPKIPSNYIVGIVGSIPELGDWHTSKALPLTEALPFWTIGINLDKDARYIEYKYVLLDAETGDFVEYEQCENRSIDFEGRQGLQIKNDEDFQIPFHWKGAGVALPVFSMRSKNSLGVGEFTDLKLLGDWAEKVGMKVVQILPINDTTANYTWRDSYPYNAITSIALHPIYLNIEALYDKVPVKVAQFLKDSKVELNAHQFMDYEAVIRTKFAFAKIAFDLALKNNFFTSKAYLQFAKENSDWLFNYAAFSYFRDENETANFRDWKEFSVFSKVEIDGFFDANPKAKKEMSFYLYLQFHLDKQLKDSVEYIRTKNIALKGDIPIGINPDSVEAWTEPHYFDFNMQTGAPPDDFAVDGQNWGFPTYKWDVMALDGYSWWRNRLKQMAKYFDAYRIDHILGFFRIWQIPTKYKLGLMGHFNPALPYRLSELREMGLSIDIDAHTEPCEDSIMLFVKDSNSDRVHPKISMLKAPVFNQLNASDQDALIKIYHHYFFERHDAFWRKEALTKLRPILKATNMLVCGEDLGMIPACVESVMNDLQILSLEVQRMPKGYGQEFGLTNEYPYMSVATSSSHDTSTLRGWWKEDAEMAQRYFSNILWKHGQAPTDLSTDLVTNIVKNHLDAPSMLSILPLQDFMAMSEEVRYKGNINDERINVPSNPNNYWRYRMHLNLEDLLNTDAFNGTLASVVRESGRYS